MSFAGARGSASVLTCALVATACAGGPLDRGAAYVNDRAHRRAALEDSLAVTDNGYATLRLAEYGVEGAGWETLPAWNPPVRAVTEEDLGRFVDDPSRSSNPDLMAPVLGEGLEWTEEALLELGRRAFETYPVQTTHTLTAALEDADSIERHGLPVDRRGHVAGLVRVSLANGGESTAFTCATCHSRTDADGALVHGASSAAFDYGALLYREGLRRGQPEAQLAEFATWGPGRVDVTPDGEVNPTAMTDLRAVRFQPYLHWAGTIDNDLIALAIRLETLMITSMQRVVRPPREVAFALALYLWRMSDEGQPAPAEGPGAELFADRCGSCHGRDGSTPRERVPLPSIGTDPTVGLSPERRTGYYRVPSLWAVADRAPLLHDGSAPTLESLIARPAQEGHAFGLGLEAADRAILADYVRQIGAR